MVPDAADALAALEDGHVVVAGAREHHRGADAGEAAADDGDGTLRHDRTTYRRPSFANGRSRVGAFRRARKRPVRAPL